MGNLLLLVFCFLFNAVHSASGYYVVSTIILNEKSKQRIAGNPRGITITQIGNLYFTSKNTIPAAGITIGKDVSLHIANMQQRITQRMGTDGNKVTTFAGKKV